MALALAGVAAAPAPARAGSRPGLAEYVELFDLIVLCRTEVEGPAVRYRVVEVWKGEYRPDRFHYPPPDGYLRAGTGRGNEDPAEGREVVFFFGERHQPGWAGGKLVDHSAAFVVTGGSIVYPSFRRNRGAAEYTLPEFRAFIRAAVRWQRTHAVAAAAGGWAFAGVEPPVENESRESHARRGQVERAASPEQPDTGAAGARLTAACAAAAIGGLVAVLAWRVWRRTRSVPRLAPGRSGGER